MNKNYNEYCMKFSNEELKKYMIEYLINNLWNKELIRCLSEDGDELEMNSSEEIGTIVFDGVEENLFINFYGIHTSIFVYDKEIMFIDENSKGVYTSSDVYNNVVYEGKLREMSHKQMLKMFSEIILCFFNAISVCVVQEKIPVEKIYKKYNYYDPYMFVINVKNNEEEKKVKVFENIIINF